MSGRLLYDQTQAVRRQPDGAAEGKIPYAWFDAWRGALIQVSAWARTVSGARRARTHIGHERWMLVLPVTGRVHLAGDAGQQELPPRAACLLPPTATLSAECEPGGLALLLPFSLETRAQTVNPLSLLKLPATVADLGDNLDSLLQQLARRLPPWKLEIDDRLRLTGLLHSALAEFFIIGFADGSLQLRNQQGPDWVQEARLALMRDCKHVDCSTQSVAASLGYSVRHLQKMFRSVFACTPSEYLVFCRVRLAAQLLRADPQLDLDRLARRCGFNNRSSFYRAFRNVLGSTPLAYAQMQDVQPTPPGRSEPGPT